MLENEEDGNIFKNITVGKAWTLYVLRFIYVYLQYLFTRKQEKQGTDESGSWFSHKYSIFMITNSI